MDRAQRGPYFMTEVYIFPYRPAKWLIRRLVPHGFSENSNLSWDSAYGFGPSLFGKIVPYHVTLFLAIWKTQITINR